MSQISVLVENPVKELCCIEYPAKIRNEDRLLSTLGGIETISEAFFGNQKLEVKFRPEDLYCKGVQGERVQHRGVVLKIKVAKHIKNRKGNNSNIKSISLSGTVDRSIQFKNLCDFEYLPKADDENGKPFSVCKDIVADECVTSNWLTMKSTNKSFLVPTVFSKIDTPMPLVTMKDYPSRRFRLNAMITYVIGDLPKYPTVPLEADHSIDVRFLKPEYLAKLKELFENRPIWTKAGLMEKTECCLWRDMLYTLSRCAFRMLSGPYRGSWVRFGYDPRKEPEARQYQIIDIQVKLPPGFQLQNCKPKVQSAYHYQSHTEWIKAERCKKSYLFSPETIPQGRNSQYQLCDIHIPEVQDALSKYEQTTKYDSKTGWLTLKFLEFVRQAIKKSINSSTLDFSTMKIEIELDIDNGPFTEFNENLDVDEESNEESD